MGAFFVYILKSSVCLAVFYLFYRLLLSKETFHRFNRFALLGILLLSCIVPFMEVTVKEPTEVHQQFLTFEELLLTVGVSPVEEAGNIMLVSDFTWREMLLLVYLSGIVFFLIRTVWSLFRMLHLIRDSRIVSRENGITIIAHRKNIAPFSWMKFVLISETDLLENGTEILAHEVAHIRKRHSIDLLVADICIFFQWFNPASWLLKQELQNIHEYEADECVINQGIDAKKYQLLLIKKAVGTRLYSMANSFNHSSLKKRITMMKKKKSSSWAYAKYLYVLPLAACAMAAFARPEVSAPLEQISNAKITDFAAILEMRGAEKSDKLAIDTVSPASTQEGVFDVVEQMPQFPGGNEAMMKFVTQNLKYPTEAHQKGIRGNVIVRFVVREDGTVTDAEVVRHADPLLEAEALRVVSLMPRWKPGRQNGKAVPVRSSLPVVFRLDGDSTSKSVMENAFVATAQAVKSESSPLFVIDGREAADDALSKLAPADIESISVLKDQTAREFYGDRGANGVVLVTTKRHAGTGKGMDKDKALIVCDGQPITGDMLEALSPERIERIEVIKDSVGRARYGAFDREGVILVTLKKNPAD